MINIFNFFPTAQSDMHLGLEANIKAKIQAFHDTLGEDAKYLTEEEEISTHELFGDFIYRRLSDKKTFQGEDEEERSELEYLHLLRNIRDKNTSLFEKIKRLPKKARTCREIEQKKEDNLVTFFRKGKLKKFFLADASVSRELTFFEAVDLFKCDPTTSKAAIPKTFYPFLDLNKAAFDRATSDETAEKGRPASSSNESYIIKRLKAKDLQRFPGFTEEDEDFLRSVLKAFENGVIPKNTSKRLKNELEKEIIPLKVLAIMKKNLPPTILSVSPTIQQIGHDRREVILSEYLMSSGS
jgi:hypothetical protein